MSQSFYKSIKKIEINDEGKTIALKGSCKAKDLQKPKTNINTFNELGIKRVD